MKAWVIPINAEANVRRAAARLCVGCRLGASRILSVPSLNIKEHGHKLAARLA